MRVLCAMSGGVDSSVAAAELLAAGHEVVGVTMRLWGGASDTGCCSIADVDDARRVANQLGVDHVVFNFTDEFDHHVVDPYVAAHVEGSTPNPCIECNRHLKFDRLLERADLLGFDAVATGHHARVVEHAGARFVARGADQAKDQSYVVHMLDQEQLSKVLFPVGHLTKDEVRRRAAAVDLRTAAKPDSQDVCFITESAGRAAFLGERIAFRPARVVDADGTPVGEVSAVELVTVGQRRGLGLPGGSPKRYVLDVDTARGVVTVGDERAQYTDHAVLAQMVWAAEPVTGPVLAQCSAHGRVRAGVAAPEPGGQGRWRIVWDAPEPRVAPGQSIVLYDAANERVLGAGIAQRTGN